MGSRKAGLARNGSQFSGSPAVTSHITYHKMHLRLVLLVALLLLGTCISSPVLSGTGGVFNSPEANAYWARRFGSGFGGFGGLRSVMESINAAAAANRFSRPWAAAAQSAQANVKMSS